jgi:hypothetical protein
VAGKEGTKQVRHAHMHLLRHQQRNVIHSFTLYGKCLVHPESLLHFPKLVYLWAKDEFLVKVFEHREDLPNPVSAGYVLRFGR